MNISNDKKSFYQWETNRFLVDEDFKINQEVCFSSVKLRKALVVKTKLKNNKIVVEVPNLLLQDYHPIMVHWVIADENGKYVTKEQEFQVLKRAKPEDYVYTETEIFSFLDLEQRLKNLEEEGINKAIADYFVKNPIQSGATSEQAAQIIQNKENIEKLNKNKLDADKLPEAINNALAQAEASGVFKGEPGKDGVVPVTGAAVGQTVKITAVDENGNPTEWEATDFPESSTQADWNQNDESAADYVKNRTHYTYDAFTDILVNEEFTYYYGEDAGSVLKSTNQYQNFLKEGLVCNIVLNNEKYDDIVLAVDDAWPSNYYVFTLNDVEYLLFGEGDYICLYLMNDFTTTNVTLSLSVKESCIKQLDPKYIKDMYYEEENVTDITGLSFSHSDFVFDFFPSEHNLNIPLALGQVWEMRYIKNTGGNNIESSYEGLEVKEAEDGTLYIGTYPDVNDLPFYITNNTDRVNSGWWRITNPTDISVTCISGTVVGEPIVHQIDPKYIKDMYHEEPVELFSVENATFDGNPYFPETPIVIEDGNTYIVNWDGVEYTCEAYIFEGISTVGNTAKFGGKGNGEPFFIVYIKYENVTLVNSFDGLATHTFSVAEMVRHTIPPKYIKDMYYDNGVTITEVVPETTVDGFEVMEDPIYGIQNAISMTPVVGATYVVNWDGVEYTTTCNSIIDIPFIYIGNENYVNMQPEGSIPFAIIFADGNVFLATESTASSHTISVTEYNHDLKQIDTKYLPILEEAQETIIETEVTDIIELRGPEYGKLLGKYAVVIDGVSETVEFIDDGIGSFVETDSFYIRSWTDPEGNVDNNGFAMEFINPDGNPHSVEIIAIKDIIKEEYLPESVTAKPDWNQSDEASSDYVKNRTHYDDITHYLIDGAFVNLDINQLYTVQIYDDIYENIPVYNAGTNNDPRWGVGDMRVINYPFGFFKYPCQPSNDIINTELSMISFDKNIYPDATINDVQIYQRILKKLDEKYFPTATDDEIIEMLTELDMIPVVTDSDGAILADESSNILLW